MRTLLCAPLGALVLVACAGKPVRPAVAEAVEARRVGDPPKPVQLIEIPQLLPLPGQMKPFPVDPFPAVDTADPIKRVTRANELARVEPTKANFINATQVWPFNPDALYQVYASPEKITDIVLEAGEDLISVSAGDTVRWVIGDTTSGTGDKAQVHVLVKPTRPDLRTNLVINTNRRTYHLEISATTLTWMSSISWQYPLDQLAVLKGTNRRAESVAAVADGIALERLNFNYEISGAAPAWRPVRAFDDGEKVYLQFPAGIAQTDMPPLFIVGPRQQAELVNYRVKTPYYIVDRLFDAAELRLGDKKTELRVRIERKADTKRANAS
jgi:type IV secretion system protein VirB9